MEFNQDTLLSIAGAITALGGAWMTITKFSKDRKKDRLAHDAEILKSAREELELKETALEAKIEAVDAKLNSLRESVGKDLKHVKETYSSEIRNLSSKIEDLRNDLRQQHANILELLSKMIER